ncbi:MAG: flagella basal body P-ring formation protein FlgA [Desulfobacteraceae bacterium 4572_130]|nr:MAG: flagella basal body P-ring formation protein FlgA [Desulfobacteraceae bacterium 4572_130]
MVLKDKYNIIIFFTFILVVFGAGSINSKETKKISINVSPSALVNSREYFLGDIAKIQGPDIIKDQIEKIYIGFSPSLGKIRTISKKQITAKIKSVSWLPYDVKITVPESVIIKRASQFLCEQQLKEIYINNVKQRLKNNDFKIRDFKVRGTELYPLGEINFTISSGNIKPIKKTSFYLNVNVNGKKCGRIILSGWVDIFDNVVCFKNSFKRGHIIKDSDLFIKKLNISLIPNNYIKNLNYAVGMCVKRNVKSKDCLNKNILENPPLIKKGDIVKLIANKGNLRIKTTGIAIRNGKLNDQITVKNISSKKIVSGKIIEKGIVNIFF